MPVGKMNKCNSPSRARSLKPADPNVSAGAPANGAKRERLLDGLSSAERKLYPMTAGLMDYFPDALAAVANVSWGGNEKHNPGQPLHHARGKSSDHADCVARHLQQRGGFDVITIDGVEHRFRHSASLAWRALALLQEEIEQDLNLPLPRGARYD
jgi:hypothetical protein